MLYPPCLEALVAFSCLMTLALVQCCRARVRKRDGRPTQGFAYAASTTLRQHRTTNLELFVPLPQSYAEYKPTILREFGRVPHVAPFAVNPNAMVQPEAKTPGTSTVPLPEPSLPRAEATHPPPVSDVRREAGHSGFPHRTVSPSSPAISGSSSRESSPVPQTVTTRPAGDKSGAHGALKTPFFETEGTQPIPSPPPFVGQEDVQVGDIFYYRNTENWKHSQLWIWCVDPAQGAHWKRVKVGYRREDGRRLTLTEKRRIPSWVGEHWYTRRGVQIVPNG
ncbi:hypothetical protein BV20DRAFT_1039370 [Pilatotrama ljubarskyi]|nr:hypothetical protein BV20DRAFT_1039370 [Pilatotrama ljubarskyi]